MEKNEVTRNAKNFDEILDIRDNKAGTEVRDQFEKNAQCFVAVELLKGARREANMSKYI